MKLERVLWIAGFGIAVQACHPVFDMCMNTAKLAIDSCQQDNACKCSAEKQLLACYAECPESAELSQQQMSKVAKVCNDPEAEAESNTPFGGILIPANVQATESEEKEHNNESSSSSSSSSSHNEHHNNGGGGGDESKEKSVHAASIPKPIHTLPPELSPSHEDVEVSNEESSSNHVFQVSAGFMLIATAFGFLVHA
ncbi:predicted protein [Lichtheimia corymbifera JMRC:FSU:9682]|uniref:Extracellular membrane protein CFEM domain-containing protein n=1 Tax=Lichtheimia corymbifera JMRC:FSU:9682 TaxID=1263082 RepID=A0A068S277_9FUNG|nr:predicted protein [Lichtheimia corymbifera JMRC:FSU:9682]